jgi:hypothetical protein
MRRLDAVVCGFVSTFALSAAGCIAPGTASQDPTAGSRSEALEAESRGKDGDGTQLGTAENPSEPMVDRLEQMREMMDRDKSKMAANQNIRAEVSQPEGKLTYWGTPGRRELGEHFGTRETPRLEAEPEEYAQPSTQQLIHSYPWLVGVPLEERIYQDDETVTEATTPFGNRGIPVDGSSMEIDYIDRRTEDSAQSPFATADAVRADIAFEDPQGNSYRLEPKVVYQPPIPGYKTKGGVMTDDVHHGETGTGSPLMPKMYTWAAFWAIGDVEVNGEVAEQNDNKLMHCMTTEAVRTDTYALAHQPDLPLERRQTAGDQRHHTQCSVMPITLERDGPNHEPVETAYQMTTGEMQSFIYVTFENDQLGDGPDWNGPQLSGPRPVSRR